MGLLRLIHAADMPDPASLIARWSAQGEGGAIVSGTPAPVSTPSEPGASLPSDFRALIALLEKQGKHQLAVQLHDQVGLIRLAPPELTLKPLRPLGSDWARELAAILKAATGAVWQITLSDEPSEPSLLDQEKIAKEQVRTQILSDPNVQAVLEAFPEAQLEPVPTMKGA